MQSQPPSNLLSISEKPCSFTYRAIYKANKFLTLHFAQYLPIYGVSPPIFFRDCGGLLTFFFSMMYSADIALEAAHDSGQPVIGVTPWLERKQVILDLFREQNLYDAGFEQHLDDLTRYWELENQTMAGVALTPTELDELLRFICSDIKAAHHFCHKLLGLPFSEQRREALHALLEVEELESNFVEYPEDVANGGFNVLKVFSQLFGSEATRVVTSERARRLRRAQDCIAALPASERDNFQQAFSARDQLYQHYYFLDQPIIPEATELTLVCEEETARKVK